MPSVLVSAPAFEPVSLAEAKAHLRVDFNDDDVMISSFIIAARQKFENDTRQSLVTQSWKLVLDQFPAPGINVGSANWYGPQWGNSPGPLTSLRADGRTGFEIFLDHSPVVSVDSISYIDVNGVEQVLAPSQYKVDLVRKPGRVVPAYGTTWPGTRNEINAVTVSYTCGYGNAQAVPEGAKNWIKLQVGAMYENREAFATGRNLVAIEFPNSKALLEQFQFEVFEFY